MIVWVLREDDGTTKMTGYDRRMRKRVVLVETNNDWTITTNGGESFQMTGGGCPDPIEFVMRLISPRNEDRPDAESIPFMRFHLDESGETWEVWECR